MNNVSVTATGTTIYISSQNSKSLTNCTKTFIQFHNNSRQTPDFIYVDLHGKITKSDNTAYLIVYGISGYHSSVDSTVYDNAYSIQNGLMMMNTDIDVDGKSIKKKIKNPSFGDDAENKMYVYVNFLNIKELSSPAISP